MARDKPVLWVCVWVADVVDDIQNAVTTSLCAAENVNN